MNTNYGVSINLKNMGILNCCMNRSQTLCNSIFILFFVLILLTSVTGYAQERPPVNMLWPSTVDTPLADKRVTQPEHEPYIRRVGQVKFAADFFVPDAARGFRSSDVEPLQNRLLNISFFPQREFRIRVDYETRNQDNVISIIGHEDGKDISTFSMTVTSESYLINFQDFETSTVYRVVGDTQNNIGVVTEIDLTKMPPILYAPPIVPPMD